MLRKGLSTWTFLLLLVAWTALPWYLAYRWGGIPAWIISLAFMTLFVMAAGYNVRGNYNGAFTDDVGRISLSRFQMLAWTLLIVSAYQVAVILNIKVGATDPLAVKIPEELWFVMGISSTSLIGAPLIVRRNRSPANNAPGTNPNPQPDLNNVAPVNREASWSDLFTATQPGQESVVDISRVQLFFFTVVAILAYGYSIANTFWIMSHSEDPAASISTFPIVSSGLVALLGISHTAYLGGKYVDPPAATGNGGNPPPQQ